MLAQLCERGAMKYDPTTSSTADSMNPIMLSALTGLRIGSPNAFSVVFAVCGIIGAFTLKLHCELDYAARTETGSAEGNEVLRILERGDAAGCLDLKTVGTAAAQELNIMTGSSALAEAGRGLYKVRAALGNDGAKAHFLFIGQQTALDYDLEHLAEA